MPHRIEPVPGHHGAQRLQRHGHGHAHAAPPARRLTTRLLMDIQEATDDASCAAARARQDSPFSSLTFAWNGAGYHGYVRDPAHGWITFAHAGRLSRGANTP